jgi:hypothetical protein
MSNPVLFVVVREDRHCDDEITIHSTRALADAAVDAFIARYADDDYTWREVPVSGWERNVECHDDGPKARIERAPLDPEEG